MNPGAHRLEAGPRGGKRAGASGLVERAALLGHPGGVGGVVEAPALGLADGEGAEVVPVLGAHHRKRGGGDSGGPGGEQLPAAGLVGAEVFGDEADPALEGVLEHALLVDEGQVDGGVEVSVAGLERAHQGEGEAVALDGEEGFDEGLQWWGSPAVLRFCF